MDSNDNFMIVGAGAAGLACAISAADQGKSVILVEKTSRLGGTVTHSLIHTLGGLYNTEGEYLNPGLPVKLAELLLQASPHTCQRKIGKTWTLSVEPNIYEHVVEAWLRDYPNLQVLRDSDVMQVQVNHGFVQQVELRMGHHHLMIQPQVLIDTTGNAEVVRMINPMLVTQGHALAGLIVQLRGVAREALQFPKHLVWLKHLRKAAEEGILPMECAMTWFDRGLYEDEVYVKINLLATHPQPLGLKTQVVQFLTQFPPFAQAKVVCVGQVGIRDGGRIQGYYCLTSTDVKQGRQFADAVCRCCWPIEYWHPQQGVKLDYLSTYYEIPLRALQVAGFNNLWVAGKCLSADELAQSSARVVGTCWAMGDKLGKILSEIL